MRFVHTSDWQIGMKADSVGKVAESVRQERLEAAKRVIRLAEEHQAEMLLVTGDLFEDNAVDRLLVRKIGEILKSFQKPVFIIPGNHDPLVPGSVWEHPVWSEAENVRLLREAEPIELDVCMLYPCPRHEKFTARQPTRWIDTASNAKIAIGLAHGTVAGLPEDDPDAPIPKDAAPQAGLDYLALGHWHSYAPFPDKDNAIRMAYSGTHETTKFGERQSGNALLVDIPHRGTSPELTLLPSGRLRWQSHTEEITEHGSLDALIRRIQAEPNPENTLLSLTLEGLLFPEDRSALTRLEEILGSRFLFGRLDASNLRPAPEDESWLEELPDGPIRSAAETIRQQAIHDADPERRAIAAQALLQLFELKP